MTSSNAFDQTRPTRRARSAATHRYRLPQTTRRGLQITLGVLWLVDAALQLQPFMFTNRLRPRDLGTFCGRSTRLGRRLGRLLRPHHRGAPSTF